MPGHQRDEKFPKTAEPVFHIEAVTDESPNSNSPKIITSYLSELEPAMSIHDRPSVVLEAPEEVRPDPELYVYKKVAQKVRPVPGVLPEEFRIVRRAHPNPLEGMPEVPKNPKKCEPVGRVTEERIEAMRINEDGFL